MGDPPKVVPFPGCRNIKGGERLGISRAFKTFSSRRTLRGTVDSSKYFKGLYSRKKCRKGILNSYRKYEKEVKFSLSKMVYEKVRV